MARRPQRTHPAFSEFERLSGQHRTSRQDMDNGGGDPNGGPPEFVQPVIDWAKNNPGKAGAGAAAGGVAAWWAFLQ